MLYKPFWSHINFRFIPKLAISPLYTKEFEFFIFYFFTISLNFLCVFVYFVVVKMYVEHLISIFISWYTKSQLQHQSDFKLNTQQSPSDPNNNLFRHTFVLRIVVQMQFSRTFITYSLKYLLEQIEQQLQSTK